MEYDVIIVGGGPGGATAALYAERKRLKVLLVDKKHFPRDKICGDAISGKSIVYLRELGLIEALENSPQVKVNHIVFSSPNRKSVKIKLIPDSFYGISSGYVCRRMVYDNVLFQAAKQKVETQEGFTVEDRFHGGRHCQAQWPGKRGERAPERGGGEGVYRQNGDRGGWVQLHRGA